MLKNLDFEMILWSGEKRLEILHQRKNPAAGDEHGKNNTIIKYKTI